MAVTPLSCTPAEIAVFRLTRPCTSGFRASPSSSERDFVIKIDVYPHFVSGGRI